jgi:ferric enterobactin receptor
MKCLRLYSFLLLSLLALIPVLFTVPAHAQGITRKVTIKIENGPLDAALQQLSTAAGISITYNPALLRKFRVTGANFRNETVEKVLQVLLKDSPYAFRISSGRYLIFLSDKAAPATAHLRYQEGRKTENNTLQPGFISGKVLDEKNKPLEFASVQLTEGSQQTTAADGTFQLRIPDISSGYQLTISFVGKQTIEKTILPGANTTSLVFVMKELSLTLDHVVVNAVQKSAQSNSSIVFDREAIEQSQAFSMADLMNRLPGKMMTAPDLHNVQNLTLRTAAEDKYANNNSLGTAIILDGIAISNNANMQNKSIAMYGQSTVTNRGGAIGGFDVPFSGIDLRDIPVNNIERIEVISGVADAKYGDITSGAVIIDRQAGKTPWQFSLGINGYSTQYSLSKGLELSRKLGAVNFSINHLRSIDDPRSDQQTYNRTTLSGMWTNYLAPKLKNTLSVSYSFRNDNIKQDPEDNTDKRSYVKAYNLNITNRTTYRIDRGTLDEVGLNMGFSKSRQESYAQFAMNKNPIGIGDKDTTGVYEGYYTPGIYTAVDHILGQPMNGSALLHIKGHFHTGDWRHQWSMGASLSLAANNGQGIIADPAAPRFVNLQYQNQRPYNFEYLPAMINTGYYLQNKMDMHLSGRLLSVTAGIRYDVQNGWGSWQPRVNAAYQLNKKWQMTLAYGIASKAPTMAYRYPAPTYFDVPVLQVYDQDPAKRIFLVYTQKIINDNSFLKPMRASQVEWGLKHNGPFISSSVFVYYKRNRNEFNTSSEFKKMDLPVYDYRMENGKLVYWPTDSTILRASLSQNTVSNGKQTDDMGIDWMISTKKIRSIATTFSLVTGLSLSRFETGTDRAILADGNLMGLYKTWYGVFPPLAYKRWLVTSQLNTSTHIPRLGFIINMNASFSWIKYRADLGNSGLLKGYTDLDGTWHEIIKPDDSDPVQRALGNRSTDAAEENDPFYMNVHLQVAKEIKKKIRFSVNAYNVFNVRFRGLSPNGKVTTLTTPVVLSGELSFKF